MKKIILVTLLMVSFFCCNYNEAVAAPRIVPRTEQKIDAKFSDNRGSEIYLKSDGTCSVWFNNVRLTSTTYFFKGDEIFINDTYGDPIIKGTVNRNSQGHILNIVITNPDNGQRVTMMRK